jgi:hypothetical protein
VFGGRGRGGCDAAGRVHREDGGQQKSPPMRGFRDVHVLPPRVVDVTEPS